MVVLLAVNCDLQFFLFFCSGWCRVVRCGAPVSCQKLAFIFVVCNAVGSVVAEYLDLFSFCGNGALLLSFDA